MSTEKKIEEILSHAQAGPGVGPPVGTFGPSPGERIDERVAILEGTVRALREALTLVGREIDDLRKRLNG